MLRNSPTLLLLLLGGLLLPAVAFADGGHGTAPAIWLVLAAVLLFAKLGDELAVRMRQPPVLGELVAGILLGNLDLFGVTAFEAVSASPVFAFLAELGVVLLLFEVGLESTMAEMRAVAGASGLVALVGVVLPMALGYGVSSLLLPEAPAILHLFVAATLCATSIGISARVFADLRALQRPEAQIVLGAAVLDDVLGLLVLAVASAVAVQGGAPEAAGIAKIIGVAGGFLAGAWLIGRFVMPGVFRTAARLQTEGVLAALAIGFALLLAGASAAAGLAAIVGAFAAGVLLDRVHVAPFGMDAKHDLTGLVRPVVAVLSPVFFVRTGMTVDLGGASASVLWLAVALFVVAVIGKVAAGYAARGKGLDRLLIGIGMVPRGEVGLIFADTGARIVIAGQPLLGPDVYMALVLMVLATTVVTPPWLSARLRRG